jgi:hypothetical protein
VATRSGGSGGPADHRTDAFRYNAGTESLQTRRWREPESNGRRHRAGAAIVLTLSGTSGSKPFSSSGESSANRASAQQLQTLDRAGWESVNHFSANPNDGTGLP